VYVEAFETILFLVKVFWMQLRDYAIRISKERYALRKDVFSKGFNELSEIPKHNRPGKHPQTTKSVAKV
jgi:hypothetical protein